MGIVDNRLCVNTLQPYTVAPLWVYVRKGISIERGIIMPVKLSSLKKGDYFTLRPIAEPRETQVYIRGEYDRSTRKYDCGKFSDISYSRELPGKTLVYTGFTF